jgi:hypothetical protein
MQVLRPVGIGAPANVSFGTASMGCDVRDASICDSTHCLSVENVAHQMKKPLISHFYGTVWLTWPIYWTIKAEANIYVLLA